MSPEGLEERLAAVEERIARALARSGRPAGAVTLVAASKTVGLDTIRAACELGVRVFGENRVQEAEPKVAALPGACWHFIGTLQRNKARRAAELFELIHSVDSARLAETLDRVGLERGRPVRVLLEVNLAGEATKGGFGRADLEPALASLLGRPGLTVHGLMTIPPPVEDPELNRGHFAALAEMAARLGPRHGATLDQLSMGMSDDFEVAIEEGATYVRVGTALFGPRQPFSD